MPEKLFDFNQVELKRLLKNDKDEKELVEKLQSLLGEHFKQLLVSVIICKKKQYLTYFHSYYYILLGP